MASITYIFFSSRRRHTRCSRDWSSDVCSSDVRKVFAGGDGQPLEVLRAVELEVHRGEFVAVVGASGAGKSTLLHLLGALDRPTGGDVWLDGSRYADLDATALAELRNRKLGFVLQFHHLLREFS